MYSHLNTKRKNYRWIHTTILRAVISDGILDDVFNFSVFSNLPALSMFSYEMKAGDKSTRQPEKIKTHHQDDLQPTLPAGSGWGPEMET